MRVCLVTLSGAGQFELTQAKYRLTEEQKHEDGQKLFDFCAECLAIFVKSQLDDELGKLKPGQELALGFTVRLVLRCILARSDTHYKISSPIRRSKSDTTVLIHPLTIHYHYHYYL